MIPTKLMTFAELSDLYLEDLLVKYSSKEDYWENPTVYDTDRLGRLLKARVYPSIGDIPLMRFDIFTHKILYKDLYHQKISPIYMYWIILNVKHILLFAAKKGLIEKEIIDSFSMHKTSNHISPMLTIEEINKMLEAAPKIQNAVMYPLTLFTGMKSSEIRSLLWSDINPENRTLLVQRYIGQKSSNEKATILSKEISERRTIYLSEQAWKILSFQYSYEFSGATLDVGSELPNQFIFHIKRDPFTYIASNSANDILHDLKIITGLRNFTFDSLRQQYVVTAMKQIDDPIAIKKLVGYKSTDSVLKLRKYINSIP